MPFPYTTRCISTTETVAGNWFRRPQRGRSSQVASRWCVAWLLVWRMEQQPGSASGPDHPAFAERLEPDGVGSPAELSPMWHRDRLGGRSAHCTTVLTCVV